MGEGRGLSTKGVVMCVCVCVCVSGVFPYLGNCKNPGIHEEIVKDRLCIYYKDLDVILVEKFSVRLKKLLYWGFSSEA